MALTGKVPKSSRLIFEIYLIGSYDGGLENTGTEWFLPTKIKR
jgi:hypothetical protein